MAEANPIIGEKSPIAANRFRVERIVQGVLFACAAASVFTTIGIVAVLLYGSLNFFREVSLWEFLTDTRWSPSSNTDPHFGVLPLICGSFLVSAGALLLAGPLGLASAIYLSEYASPRVRGLAKPTLEILANVPSVVFGFLAVAFVAPAVQGVCKWWGIEASAFNAANAAIMVAVMILPLLISLSEDVLRSVPRSLRSAAFALGSTKFEVIVRVILPAARSGVAAVFLLAICRVIGETMVVTLAAGSNPNLTLNPLDDVLTMTAYIVQVSLGSPSDTLQYRTIFAVGFALFVITMTVNLAAQAILARMRARYE